MSNACNIGDSTYITIKGYGSPVPLTIAGVNKIENNYIDKLGTIQPRSWNAASNYS